MIASANFCNFYPRSPCGERPTTIITICIAPRFLSTLSLRRATIRHKIPRQFPSHFYPRSPCGERQRAEIHASSQQEFLSTLSLRRATGYGQYCIRAPEISIHALLAESDRLGLPGWLRVLISIHALLAESDRRGASESIGTLHFYPRSPCGERQCSSILSQQRTEISIHALLAESDPELDTLANKAPFISIHALLAESDQTIKKSPCKALISIHALLAESDIV